MSRTARILVGIVLGLAAAALIATWQIAQERGAGTGTASGTAAVGGPFTLVDQTGRTVTEADYAGKLKLIFFGYTYCPDICPTQLQTVAETMDALGSDAAQVQPIFITIDPERDTPAQLAAYVKLFHPALVGLTGTPEQIAKVAKEYRVYFARVEQGAPGEYLMDHGTYVYLMGRDNSLITVFDPRATADAMAKVVRQHLN
jgi:protein SCO1/2